MLTFKLLLALKATLLGAVYGRIDGGGVVQTQEWVERLLVMSLFMIACSTFAGPFGLLAVLGVVGIATGHGQYLPSMSVKYIKPEFVDKAVSLVFGQDPRSNKIYWDAPIGYTLIEQDMYTYGPTKLLCRNMFGMFLTGTLVGLPAFVLSFIFDAPQGYIFLLTGFAKVLSYLVSWKLFQSTPYAEYMNGALRGALCVAVILSSVYVEGL
jgi:hypothetical protein